MTEHADVSADGRLSGSKPHVDRYDRAIIGLVSVVLWVLVAVFAVGVVAGGLLRIRAWLAKPVPPEVIEAAHRDDDKDD